MKKSYARFPVGTRKNKQKIIDLLSDECDSIDIEYHTSYRQGNHYIEINITNINKSHLDFLKQRIIDIISNGNDERTDLQRARTPK